ncbi:hypothetical protein EJ110_NYTH03408 [Nymphaea thermarum]|nr:hypothetical protein EJ110_NYTH03408 [Nymphaea thermarum]
MAGSPSGSIDLAANGNGAVKFLCSYGGKILPRHPDGKLRYVGGETRVLSVDRSVCFAELAVKLGELCGEPGSVCVRCQLPTEDLDALVSVTSDEDLLNLIEEYDRFNRGKPSPLKIRAFLSPRRGSTKKPSSPPSPSLSTLKLLDSGKLPKPAGKILVPSTGRCIHQILAPERSHGLNHHHYRHLIIPVDGCSDSAFKTVELPLRYYYVQGNPNTNLPMVHNGNQWQ